MAKTMTSRQTDHVSENKKGTVEIVASEDVVPSFYTNNTSVETSLWDVRIKFAETVAADKENNITKVRELAYIRMSPQHALVVANLLLKQLQVYEKEFGSIPAVKGA